MFERHHYNRSIAIELKSADKAFMVEFIKFSVEYKAEKPEQYEPHTDGRHYTWDTQDAWHNRLRWLSHRTIQNHLRDIRESGLVHAEQLSPDNRDRTLYYTINDECYYKMEQMHNAEFASSTTQNLRSLNTQNLRDVPSNNLTKNLTKNTRRRANELHKSCVPFDETMANEWMTWAKTMSPNGRFNLTAFANAIMKMRTKFELSEQQITFMLEWIKADDFWAKNAISPASLLKPSPSDPSVSKLDRVISSIKARKKSKSERVMESILRTESEVLPDDYNPLRLT